MEQFDTDEWNAEIESLQAAWNAEQVEDTTENRDHLTKQKPLCRRDDPSRSDDRGQPNMSARY
jgi:hypothetical protein|tara:strand:- start:226 stop:414 length:189 start_codon:yes stop_codon:yes gene_type:complete